jgi:hypothetical protein
VADRSIRSLEHLENSASTARVLNLRLVRLRKAKDPDYQAHPLFQSPALNSAIIVKHRLRGNEADMFVTPRRSATKIMIPIENNELRLGARFVFIGQKQFETVLHDAFAVDLTGDSPDRRTLRILDETPTLDPFLLREQLRRNDLEPARCYFDLSDADAKRMFSFAQREVEPLVRLSMGEGPAAIEQAAKLTHKILSNSADASLEPLRRTLQLDPAQFQEGAFCWKAFLYYKWQLSDLLPRVNPVLEQIRNVRPRGPMSDETKIYLHTTRETLSKTLVGGCRKVKGTLEIYDAAYRNLTEQSDPSAFRDFLLKAPALFNDLGERLGAIEHIVSFWRYRFPDGKKPIIAPEELADIFMDFEGSLGAEREALPSLAKPEMIINAA